MNHNVARHTANAFRINFTDMINESSNNALPEGLTDLLLKVRDFADQAGELSVNRPDSNTAYFQEDMAKVWFHAQKALADAQVVKAKITRERDDSAQAESDRFRRSNVTFHAAWIEAILKNVVNAG